MRPEPNAALAAILRRDQEAGVDVFDDGHREPRAPGPPVVLPPLLPPMIPPPDWRAEQEAAERRRVGLSEPDPEPPPPERTPPDRRYPRTTTTGRAWRDHR